MTSWDTEKLDFINSGMFRVNDAGPLHAPINSFSLKRNDKLNLILETIAPVNAKSCAPEHPNGTLLFNTDTVSLTNIHGVKAVFRGVVSCKVNMSSNYENNQSELRETARINEVEAVLSENQSTAYIIDWLENWPDASFHWPDSIDDEIETKITRTIGAKGDSILLNDANNRRSLRRHAAKIVVQGVEIYLCAVVRQESDVRIKPGCIIYLGAPDEAFRKKIRTAISFTLGSYLVDLGSTSFSDNWQAVSFKSKSAYSIDKKVFDLFVMPPAPLGNQWQNEIDRAHLTRAVNAIFEKYDELDFGNLNWAYWHARSATIHISPVHFGAAIEALQRRYIDANPGNIATEIIADTAAWKHAKKEIKKIIANMQLQPTSEAMILQGVKSLNEMPHRVKMEAVLKQLDIRLSSSEEAAWRRRNQAAHGMEMKTGDQLALINDVKLLNGIIIRMVLRMTGASDHYIDYATPGFPGRALSEPAVGQIV